MAEDTKFRAEKEEVESKASALEMLKNSVSEEDSKPTAQLSLKMILGGDITSPVVANSHRCRFCHYICCIKIPVPTRYDKDCQYGVGTQGCKIPCPVYFKQVDGT